MRPTHSSRSQLDIALIIVVGSAVVLTGGLFWYVLPGQSPSLWQVTNSVEAAGDLIRSWGNWGVAASVTLMVFSALTPFPAELVAVANGVVFGPALGAAITWGGGMIGALLAFCFSRAFAKPIAGRLMNRRFQRWTGSRSELESGTTLLFARLIPLIPFCLLNYAAGMSNMGWRTFVWATSLGILPLTILMAFAGDWLGTLQWQIGSVVLAAGLTLWLVFHRRSGRSVSGQLED